MRKKNLNAEFATRVAKLYHIKENRNISPQKYYYWVKNNMDNCLGEKIILIMSTYRDVSPFSIVSNKNKSKNHKKTGSVFQIIYMEAHVFCTRLKLLAGWSLKRNLRMKRHYSCVFRATVNDLINLYMSEKWKNISRNVTNLINSTVKMDI